MRDVDAGYIPGTDQLLISEVENSEELMRDGEIVLVPQPTISPNDPLTWSKSRKFIHLILVLMFTGLTAATSNACAAAEDGIQEEFNISDNVFNTGDGLLFLGIGWWTLFSAPSVYLYGSRIGYLFGALLSIGGNIWYANCKTVGDVVWSQMFIGASESVAEAVTQLSITQVFYQHQATHYIAMYVLVISIGTFLGPLIGGIIANNIGWHWVGYVAAICSGFVGILMLFGLEETYFDRAHFLTKYTSDSDGQNLDGREVSPQTSGPRDRDSIISARQDHTDTDEPDTKKAEPEKDQTNNVLQRDLNAQRTRFSTVSEKDVNKKVFQRDLNAEHSHFSGMGEAGGRPDIVQEAKQTVADEPKSYWQRMALITPAVNLKGFGFKQYLKRIFLYLQVLAFPPVLYSGLQWGAQDAWLSFYIDLESDNYTEAPWNYSDLGVGLMNIPSLIGATIGCVYGAWFSDWFVLWCAKRNNGVREAETRLWCLLPAGIISPVGMFLLGIGTQHEWAWYAPYVGLGMIGFGWGCCGDLSMSYLVDCYPEMVLEGMLGVSLINNNIATVFSFVVDRWTNSIGVQNTFISIGVLNFFFVFLSLPMIYYGKRCRMWTRGMYFRFVEQRDSLNAS